MPLCLKRLLPVYLWNVGVGGSSWIWYYRSIWLQHGRQHVQNSNMLNAVKVKVWLTDWPDDGYLLIHVSVMSPHEGINRTRPFFVHVRWAYMQAFGLCDECDCNISSFCRGVLLELNSLLRTFLALIIKKKKRYFYQILNRTISLSDVMSSQTKLEFLVSCRVNQAYPDLRLCILKKKKHWSKVQNKSSQCPI